MRVLSISTLFPNPGKPSFGIFVGNQMRAVAARGDVDLVMVSPIGIPPFPLSLADSFRTLGQIPVEGDAAGLPVHYPRFTLIPRIGGDSNPGRIARAVLPLARRLHAERPFDLVDAQFFFPDGPAAAIVADALGLPLTIKARGADIHYWGMRATSRRQMLHAARSAARLLAVSEALGRDMATLGMPDDRIVVHYTGLDRERFRPIDRHRARQAIAAHPELLVPTDGPLIVTPGALIPRKGQRLVIEALTRLPGARLALAGAGEDELQLRDQAAELGVADRTHFLGVVLHDLLPQLLSAADVMALPSSSEGLANAWVESLGCGTPIVITNVGGASELVQHPSAGKLVERDAEAIAHGIREVLERPRPQSEVAGNAARFSWDANAERLVEIWREATLRAAA